MSDQSTPRQPEQGERAEEQVQDLSVDAVEQARGGDLTDVRGGFSKVELEYKPEKYIDWRLQTKTL